jgi:hypothetical protein
VIPESLKQAAMIQEIVNRTAPDVAKRAKGVRLTLQRADPTNGMWTFKAAGSEGKDYLVRIKAEKKGTITDVNKLQVRVSCTCDFFRFQGPEHHAKNNDYLYGKPRGTATSPKEKDPSGKHWACKHVLAALTKVSKYRTASETGWVLDGPLAQEDRVKTASDPVFDAYMQAYAEMVESVHEAKSLPPDWKGRPGNYLAGIGKGMFFAFKALLRNGKAWVSRCVQTKSPPPNKAKALEMAARMFLNTNKEPRNILKWFEDNEARFQVLIDAGKWPDRSEESGGIRTIGPFRVHDTLGLPAKDWERAEQIINQAVRALPHTGVSRLGSMAYGDIFLVGQIERKNWAAWYNPNKDIIFLRPNMKGVSLEESVRNLVHEIGHRWYRKVAPSDKTLEWAKHHASMSYATPQFDMPEVGGTFPEVFLVNGKKPKVWAIQGLNYTLADVATDKVIGMVDQFQLRKWLSDAYKKLSFPTLYAASDAEEHFCESLSMKAMGRLTGANLEAFDRIFG